ncbi:MAG: hypothetical protein L0956_07110 [Candidatus Mariimomonas ferrooxydans]
MKILFLSNFDIDDDKEMKAHITSELEERFGSINKIGLKDVLAGCRGKKEYEDFFTDLWQYVAKIYGEFIPYGKYYEEIFSMVRFVSAWQPKTGRQSEMRMLYNFLSIFGEHVPVEGKWDYLEFFLMPSYEDIKNREIAIFPEFSTLFKAIEKIWAVYFINERSISGTKIKSMRKSWPQAKDDFIEKVSYPLLKAGKIDNPERLAIERLVDSFNRHSWRAAFFIWSLMTIFEKDYIEWDKEFFINFYTNKNGVGISEKVVACFLQQGFKNDEVIPIDTWVESFYYHVLGIESLESFFSSFDKLGKIERVIWLSSQANKTNIKTFFDTLWCIRYGDTGNNELRTANPIACYECKLRLNCCGYKKIRDVKVLIKDKTKIRTEDLLTAKGAFKGKIIRSAAATKEAQENKCFFICITEDKVPKKVFKNIKGDWKLIDEFSGYILTNQKVSNDDTVISVKKLIDDLPSFIK